MRLAGAVDIGATNTKIGIVGEDGRVFRRTTIPTRSGNEPDHLVDAIAAELRPMLDAVTDERNQVVAIGIAIAGFLDREHTMMVANANLRGLCDFPLRRAFEERFELDCHLEVDSNATTMAEYRFGMGRGITNLLGMVFGTGVGGGFVVNGKPWHGVLGMAGEIGHMTVIPEGRPCLCGNRGCLEQYASATAIRRAAMEAADSGESPCLAAARAQDSALTARTVYACAQAGDPAAMRIFAVAGSALGIALGNLINAFNLPLYVIGGGVSRAWNQFAPAMFEQLRTRSIVFRAGEEQKRTHRATEVVPAMLQDRAGLLGAARLPVILRPDRCCSMAV